MSLSDRLYHLIALCYEASSTADGWSRFAAELASSLSANRCTAVVLNENGQVRMTLWSHDGSAHPSGDWLPNGFDRIAASMPEGGVRAVATPDDLTLIGAVPGMAGQRSLIAVGKPADARDFGREETALLEELLPHVDRALQVYWTIRASENRRGALTEILDRLPEAIFLVDDQGAVVSSNLAARATAALNDGIVLKDDRIGLAEPGEQETLRGLIERAARRLEEARPTTGHADDTMTMSVSRPSGKTAFPIVVTPVLCRGVPDGRPAIVAAVITKDTEQRGSVMVPDLAIAFGLTPGEKRLAGLVAGGLGLKEAAETLGVTRNTVRTHMKRVYAKTGVHSQADLVRLLSRGSIELRLLKPDESR